VAGEELRFKEITLEDALLPCCPSSWEEGLKVRRTAKEFFVVACGFGSRHNARGAVAYLLNTAFSECLETYGLPGQIKSPGSENADLLAVCT